MAYLTENQIDMMAEAAAAAFEMTADSNAAVRAAAEFAMDEWGVKPRRTAVLAAYSRSQAMWEAARMSAAKACRG